MRLILIGNDKNRNGIGKIRRTRGTPTSNLETSVRRVRQQGIPSLWGHKSRTHTFYEELEMKTDMQQPNLADAQQHRHTGATQPRATAGASGTRYTCSMHPEVVRDAPGNCPKCGMTLVPM